VTFLVPGATSATAQLEFQSFPRFYAHWSPVWGGI
jgi:hypothetical protein